MKFKEIFTDYNEPKRAYGGEIDPYDGNTWAARAIITLL